MEINHLFKLYHAPVAKPADYLSVTRRAGGSMALHVVGIAATTSTARASAFLWAFVSGHL